MRAIVKEYFREMRIHHYIKNLLIFFPVFFNGSFFVFKNWLPLIMGFFSFSLCASLIYIINDIRDLEKDRLHPKKCKRPIAAGTISVPSAQKICILLGVMSIILSVMAVWYGAGVQSLCILILYFALNIIYSVFRLKDVVLLDIVILASGFLLRLMMGSALTGISISTWLYLVVLSGAFYLGFGKRRSELKTNQDKARKVLSEYTESYLGMSMHSCMSLTIIFFALWCIEKQQSNSHFDYLWFIPIMMILFFKYNLDLEQEKYTGDPTEIILGDRVIQILCLLAVGLMFVNLYL